MQDCRVPQQFQNKQFSSKTHNHEPQWQPAFFASTANGNWVRSFKAVMPFSSHEKTQHISDWIKFENKISDIHSFSLQSVRDRILKISSALWDYWKLSKQSLRFWPNSTSPGNEIFAATSISGFISNKSGGFVRTQNWQNCPQVKTRREQGTSCSELHHRTASERGITTLS